MPDPDIILEPSHVAASSANSRSSECLLVGTDPDDGCLEVRGANGNMGYKLTDNIGYTFICVRLRLTTLQASF